MDGNENFMDSVDLPRTEFVNLEQFALITHERTEKIELLIHLLANSEKNLVVSGPKGIGKTTLLDALSARLDSERYCILKGSQNLTIAMLMSHIANDCSSEPLVKNISSKTSANHSKRFALIIDDAGKLIPGLIQLIIEYTSGIPGLIIVFALTPDELFLKNSSDPSINDAYFIEVPPLSEQQCHEFIGYFANRPNVHRSLNGFNDNSAAKIYRETHGVPGKMIAALSGPKNIKYKDHASLMLVAAVTALIAITFGIQWASSSQIF